MSVNQIGDQINRGRESETLSAAKTLTADECRFTRIVTAGYTATLPSASGAPDADVLFINNTDSNSLVNLTGNTSADDVLTIPSHDAALVMAEGAYWYSICSASAG